MARGDLGLQFFVRDDAALLEIDQQHLARLQAPLLDDVLFRNRQHARLRRHDDGVVLGDEIARRAQPVAVERRADLAAVGEGHRRRTVPRLHQAGVILVEGAPLRIHRRIADPGLRDQHHRGVREAVAAHRQEFERVVEAGGVRLAFIRDRPELARCRCRTSGEETEACRAAIQLTLPRSVLISPLCATIRIRMRELPGRERVG